MHEYQAVVGARKLAEAQLPGLNAAIKRVLGEKKMRVPDNENNVEYVRNSWEEFLDNGFLWYINRLLHILGWCIVIERDGHTNKVVEVYPARIEFRGFSEEIEEEGFKKVTDYMYKNSGSLRNDTDD